MKSLLFAQRDFSGGQVNAAARRRDDIDAVRTGARTMLNWRIEATAQIVPRPGRRPLFISNAKRTERLRMSSAAEYYLNFLPGGIIITDTGGNVITSSASIEYLWSDTTLNLIQWVQASHQIVITFPLMRPKILTWDTTSGVWTFGELLFQKLGTQSLEAFYNFRQDSSTMSYSGTTGNVTITSSVPYFSGALSVGLILSIGGQQVEITSVISSTAAVGAVLYRLPDAVVISVTNSTPFAVGQIVTAQTQNIKFEVSAVGVGQVIGVLISTVPFDPNWKWKPNGTDPDVLVGPYGSAPFSGIPTIGGAPYQTTTRWQEQFMSQVRGWPAGCFYDRGRLGFCNFPQKPEAVLWSSINEPTSFWVDSQAAATQPEAGAAADAAILEFIPPVPGQGLPRVLHVVGWGDQFVFSDLAVFQIPISSSGNPLKPGSVEFRTISNDGVGPIRPIPSQDVIVYMNAGLNRVCVIRATGALTRPYISQDMSDNHSDLFTAPVTFTLAIGDGTVSERYIYVLNADGSLVIGKFTADRQFVGWAPWSSQGSVQWVSSFGSSVTFNVVYVPPSTAPAGGAAPTQALLEYQDTTVFLDMAVPINAPPVGISKPGFGPLWFYPGASVTLMDGNLDLGERQTDASGNIVAVQGEDLSSPTLVAGLFSMPVFEPFSPGAQPGEGMGQRQKRRKIKRAMVNVEQSSGFTLGNRTFALTYFGEDATQQPVLRDGAFSTRPIGRTFDPTITLTKDRPGPLRLCEFSLELTI